MKRLIWLLVILAVATFIGVALNADNGYALFSYQGTTIEMSLVALAFFLIVGFVILYFLFRTAGRFARIRRGAGEYRRMKSRQRANRAFIDGLIDVSEGRWEKGEREIVRAADTSDMALINYLAAARAAQLQGAHERRDQYLHKAYEIDDKARMAVLLTQAELQIAHRQFELALATLRRMQELNPRHAYALRLLSRLYAELGDYEQLHALLPSLRKHDALPAQRLDEIELKAATALMSKAAGRGDAATVNSVWNGLSKSLRNEPAATHAYAAALISANAADAADEFIRARLKAHWDEELARLYGTIKTDAPARQLARAEAWLGEHGDSPALLLSLGRLAIACELWGKAKSYLEASVKHGKRPEAYAELGRLLESMGEETGASSAYKSALALTTETPAPSRKALPAASPASR